MNRQTNNNLASKNINPNNIYTDYEQNPNFNDYNQYDDDNDIGQALDQSRFMLQQLNLSQTPTQQQILEKAQQLQIDDLQLAKQSLTKQLPAQWKPYCNRYHQIYYINLVQRLAYIDHPIDMYYKMLYYQKYCANNSKSNNGNSSKNSKNLKKIIQKPEFRRWSIQEVCGSLDLVQEQIRNYRNGNKKSTLRIVYEQPSQQQTQSVINPKSPINPSILSNNSNTFNPKHNPSPTPYQHSKSQQQQQQQNDELSTQQLQLLYTYQQNLNKKYQNEYQNYKNSLKNTETQLQKQSQISIKQILQFRINNEFYQKYEQDIKNKNIVDFKKQQQRVQREYRVKEQQYVQNVQIFGELMRKFREIQRNAQNFEKMKEISGRVAAMQRLKFKVDMQKQRILLRVKDNLVKQFNQNLSMLIGHSAQHQRTLKHQLQKLYKEGTNNSSLTNYNPRKRKIFTQSLPSTIKNNVDSNKNTLQVQQPQNAQKINDNKNSISVIPDFSYEQLKKQIKQLNLWTGQQQNHILANSYQDVKNISNRHGLNLRLRMKII